MTALYDPARHEPLAEPPWTASRARDTVAAICRDAESAFDPRHLWPQHPADHGSGMPAAGEFRGLYLGAAGMLHALARLAAAGYHDPRLRVDGVLEELLEASPDEPGARGSLMVGRSGTLLVAHRLAPSPATATAVADAIASQVDHPANEIFYGAPGTMLAARAMFARTGEARFADLWRASARTLLGRRNRDGLWTCELAGERLRYVGAAHGFAGNAHSLLAAPDWLEDREGVEARAVATARELALRAGGVANWAVLPGGSRTGAAPRLQWCHGAAGMVTSLAGARAGDDAHGSLLAAGGELVWRAGPVAGNAGLCHGTAGNGFAFLALFARTADERWLARARAFAAHALGQTVRLRAVTGRGRYTLFTGDIGAALLAAACLDGDPAFPGIDDL